MTAALAAVLCGLGAFTLWGTLQATQATEAQGKALVLDAIFSEASAAVAVQEMQARHYQLEPSVASRERYLDSAAQADASLRRAVELSTGDAKQDALRLQAEQSAYRQAADQLIVMVTDRDPDAIKQDRLEVTPAYYTLQHDITEVSRSYHTLAQKRVADLRNVQTRIFAATMVGFAVGLALVAAIWRVMLAYQRRVVEHARASQRQALHDPLTGLANRLLFQQRLDDAIEAAGPGSDRKPAVMLIDMNGFKAVNDTLGHHAGDEVLIQTGNRLRKVCGEGDTVARLGGDEFAVLLRSVSSVEAALEIAERAGGALRRNFALPVGSAAVSGSVGMALGAPGCSAEDMLRHADAAMYRAKSSGKGVALYDPEIDIDQPGRMALFADLRTLLTDGDPDGQLVLYYQPQVSIADATVPAVEALVRWRHPHLGLLSPDAFLGVAETGGLELPLTYHLLRIAAAEAAGWNAQGRPLTVSVNVSPNCLLDEAFVGQVRAALTDHGLPPHLLRLEITESGMTTDPDRAQEVLRRIRHDGVQVSIDDFGTGFSSLNQLKLLTADELKIDRIFIQDLATDPGDAILVRSAIELAHNLGLFVTAEGVEDLTALAMLADLGCDQVQGFALARPVPADVLFAECAKAAQIARSALKPARGPMTAAEVEAGV
ncbi:putative bifunctional diguanylate cyclase/phosphodiesterase [Catellatospora tritici]|uniref:putative bifunctional diguanylate cyclase/phosphodiesterase n=1 Tax=Catellatospora tritici TaxID=2851566 RepID=UPI001C2DE36C|nr:bifunctional diguanylate cyclase/phosphodiesterase [Catellatospora tritici]MBV1855671.1 bifunctional diguanylate cyclase/phosphodiesterase [Catellatospora tritici]